MPVDDYSKGVVFYLNSSSGRIVGILTWNVFGKMELAKQVYHLVCSLLVQCTCVLNSCEMVSTVLYSPSSDNVQGQNVVFC